MVSLLNWIWKGVRGGRTAGSALQADLGPPSLTDDERKAIKTATARGMRRTLFSRARRSN
jgi:hypothetical protein